MKKITTDQRVLQSMQANLKTNHSAQVGSVVMVGEEPNTTTFIIRDGLVLSGLGVSGRTAGELQRVARVQAAIQHFVTFNGNTNCN